MGKRVAVIKGDGIGPEIMNATLKVLDELGICLEYVFVEAGLERWRRTGVAITQEDLEVIKSCDALLKGPVCLLYTSPSPRDISGSRMPSSA